MPAPPGAGGAPTRSDPVVAALSEVVGGPLGSRAGHHPWWSPQRVVLATTALVLVAGMASKAACVPSAWTGDTKPYARLCWTEVAGVSAAGAEAPWPASYLTRLAERVGGAVSSGSDTLAAVALLAIVLAGLALLATRLLAHTDPVRPWAAAGWAAAPVLAVHWLSWDLLAAVGVAIALWGWGRRRWLAVGIAGFLVAAFAHPLVTTADPDTGSLWLVAQQVSGSVPGQPVRLAVAGLVVALAAVGARVVVRRRGGTGVVALARTALVPSAVALVVVPSAPPEAALLLLPLAAVAALGWRDLLAWQACELVAWAITGWYLAGLLAPSDGGEAGVYWVAVVLRVAGLLWLASAALSGPDGGVALPDLDGVEGRRGETDPDVDVLADPRHPRPLG